MLSIYEIAKSVNVSPATVSRALNPELRHKVKPQTLKKILAFCETHNYYGKLAARSLASGKTFSIGLILSTIEQDFASPFFAQEMSGILNALAPHNYTLKVIPIPPGSPDQIDKEVHKALYSNEVDGFILNAAMIGHETFLELKKRSFPVVILTSAHMEIHLTEIPTFGVNNQTGFRELCAYLSANGHTRIAILGSCSYPDIRIELLQQEAEKRNWNIRINLLSPERYEAAAADPDAAGIVCATPPIPLPRTAVPVVNYGMTGWKEIPSVIPDNYAAGYAAGIHLCNIGIENICFVTSAPRKRPVPELHFQERFHGLKDAVRNSGGQDGIPLIHWALNHPCRKEVETWIADQKRNGGKSYPVLVVGNRSMAVEIGIYLSAVGMRVPDDIGILSFIKRNSFEQQIPIDTFDFDHRQMGEQIMLLLDQAQKGGKLPSRVQIPMTLTEEGSVRHLRTMPL